MAPDTSSITRQWVSEWSANYRAGAETTPWRPGEKLQQAMTKYPNEAKRLTSLGDVWQLEEYVASIGREVHESGAYSRPQFLIVCYWKSPRPLKFCTWNKQKDVAGVTRAAFDQLQPWRELRRLHGVGVPMASALLTAWDPDKYTVIDTLALRTLAAYKVKVDGRSFSRNQTWWERNYELYLCGCLAIADRVQLSLREVDRALWRWGKADAKRERDARRTTQSRSA